MATERTSPITVHPPAIAHEHGWATESIHPTSEGVLAYVACASCGIRRVDVRGVDGIASNAASTLIGRPVDPA